MRVINSLFKMFGRNTSLAGTVWVCYVCILNGSSALEGRRFLSLQLTNQALGDDDGQLTAEIMGSIGSLMNGKAGWKTEGTALSIGARNYLINDCTKDFLKITDTSDRTAYLFIAQQSRSYLPF